MTPQQRYYHKNKEKILQKARDQYLKNIDQEHERSKNYSLRNLDSIKDRRNKFLKLKRQQDPTFKLRCNVSRSIRRALRGSKNRLSFLKYVNYTIDILKTHLESNFEPWMTWNNYGKFLPKTWNDNESTTWTWQIDHIISQSSLKYSAMNESNFSKCWSLENLRPLSAKENFLKGNK